MHTHLNSWLTNNPNNVYFLKPDSNNKLSSYNEEYGFNEMVNHSFFHYLKNTKCVGTARKLPSEGRLTTRLLTTRDEEPPPSKL